MTKVIDTKYKLQAPEGGWGYVIVAAISIILTVGSGNLSFFGILYEDFLSEHENNIEKSAMANAIYMAFYNFIGLIANQLLKKYSCRFVALLGGIAILLASFCNIFVNSFIYLYISHGVIQGIGVGLLYHAIFRTFNDYFIIKRNLIMFVTQSIFAAINIALPYLIQLLKDTFGFRGTLLILFSINLHVIPAVLTLHPVTWHLSKINENNLLEQINLNIETLSNKSTNKFSDLNQLDDKHSSKNTFWKNINNFLELSLLKDPVYVNISFGLTLVILADLLFLAILPSYLQNLQYDSETVAYLMTIYMFSDFIGRIVLTSISACFPVNNRYLVVLGAVSTAILRIVFTMFDKKFYLGIMICIIAMGLLRCLFELTIFLIFAEYSHSRFNAALGIFQILNGVLIFLTGPISKLIITLSGENVWVIHMYTICLLVCAILWILEFLYYYFKK